MKQRYNALTHELCVQAVLEAFDGKWMRRDVMQLINKYGGVSYGRLKEEKQTGCINARLEAAEGIAYELEQRVLDLMDGDPEALDLEPVVVRERPDGMTGKIRKIADLCPMHQLVGHLIKLGLDPLLKARIEWGQCASVPGRGQTGLKRRVERWLRRKSLHIRHAKKTDVSNAYGSLMYAAIIVFISAEIPSARWIMVTLYALGKVAPGGHLIIGGYLDGWLFNLAMSYAVRYVLSLSKERRGQKTPLVVRVVTHMDDFGLLGRRKADVVSAARKLARWMACSFALTLKLGKDTEFLSFEEEHRRRKETSPAKRGCPSLDMGGYRMHRSYTTMRKRIFLRVRRVYLRAGRDVEAGRKIKLKRAQRAGSYSGYFKHTASRRVQETLNVKNIKRLCGYAVSCGAKKGGKTYATSQCNHRHHAGTGRRGGTARRRQTAGNVQRFCPV